MCLTHLDVNYQSWNHDKGGWAERVPMCVYRLLMAVGGEPKVGLGCLCECKQRLPLVNLTN